MTTVRPSTPFWQHHRILGWRDSEVSDWSLAGSRMLVTALGATRPCVRQGSRVLEGKCRGSGLVPLGTKSTLLRGWDAAMHCCGCNLHFRLHNLRQRQTGDFDFSNMSCACFHASFTRTPCRRGSVLVCARVVQQIHRLARERCTTKKPERDFSGCYDVLPCSPTVLSLCCPTGCTEAP